MTLGPHFNQAPYLEYSEIYCMFDVVVDGQYVFNILIISSYFL